MPDWKKVAADRLRELRILRARLEQDRKELASNAVRVMQMEIHGRCLTSISGKRWREAFDAMEREIAEQS